MTEPTTRSPVTPQFYRELSHKELDAVAGGQKALPTEHIKVTS